MQSVRHRWCNGCAFADLSESVRARSLDAAQELFWKQADFGYVKERLSELKTLCKATRPVSLLISLVPTRLWVNRKKQQVEIDAVFNRRPQTMSLK